MSKLRIEVTKFTVVGALNFVLTFVVFTVMLKIFALNYLLSLLSAWIFGLIFSFILNFTWVFGLDQKIEFRAKFFKFFLASLLSISLNLIVLDYVVEVAIFDPFFAQIVIMPFFVVFNFATAKFWSLRN